MPEQRNQHSPPRNEAYLHFLREQPCCVCGRTPADAHHPRIGFINSEDGTVVEGTGPGMGQRSSDRWALPLCRDHHVELLTMRITW